MTLDQFQQEQKEWRERNFEPSELGVGSLLGIVEEVGELSHAHLKQLQGIRGTSIEHEEAARDAVGDILVYLVDYCTQRGWNLQDILDFTWNCVKTRNWKKNPETGVE